MNMHEIAYAESGLTLRHFCGACDWELRSKMTIDERAEFSEHLKLRVPAVQEAVKRTRFAFFLCTLAAFASIICLWNGYISTNRFIAEREMPTDCGSLSPRDCGERDRQRELLVDGYRSWVDSTSININLLGIRIGVSDFAVMDSMGLYILLYYSLLTIRRENREIGQLLRDTSAKLDQIGYAAYCAVNSYMVFNLNRGDDRPIDSLVQSRGLVRIRLIRQVFDILVWAPAVVILLTIISDVLSLISVYPYPFSSLYRPSNIYHSSLRVQLVEFIIMDSAAVLFGILSVTAIRHIRKYGSATRAVLDEFSRELHKRKFLSSGVSEA
jgi:hypothetical protein